MAQTRTLETMMDLFRCAKLDASMSAFVRPVQFADHLISDEFKLFEVDPELADELCTNESRTVIELKDEPGKSDAGRVFACATEKTYSVTETETSNTLLLIPNGCSLTEKPTDCKESQPAIVQAMKTSYLELQPCIAPSLRLLKQKMLSSTEQYHGPIDEDNEESDEESTPQNRPSSLTRSELHSQFPCSANELLYAFSRLRIFEIDGFARLVDPDYLVQVLRDIFFYADEHALDWRHQGFPAGRLLDDLQSRHPRSILKQIIGFYFCPRSKTTYPNSTDLVVYPRNSKICQLIGEQLLSVTQSFDLADFKDVWKSTVPSGLRPKLKKHLTCAGRAFCRTGNASSDLSSSSRTRPTSDRTYTTFRSISLLRSEDLPDDSVEARLEALFERCPSWSEPELASFLIDLIVPPDTTGKPYLDAAIGPLTFSGLTSTDSDFEYSDELETDSTTVDSDDTPKAPPASVVTVLTRLCRATMNTNQGRIYTKKYANA